MKTIIGTTAIFVLLGIRVVAGLEYVYAPSVIAQGQFHPVAHKGSGSAVLCRLPNGRRSLRLTNFSTASRPDLAVYLISAPDAFDNETVTGSRIISLGPLKPAPDGQVYDVPAGVDLRRYHAVTIWSRKYQVNFTTAPLR
jgi:hypothetical protein